MLRSFCLYCLKVVYFIFVAWTWSTMLFRGVFTVQTCRRNKSCKCRSQFGSRLPTASVNICNSKLDYTRVAKVEIISRGIRENFRNVAYVHPFTTSPATKNAQRKSSVMNSQRFIILLI